ncbi:IclR family transcriptional regulator [Phytoactinopolyspora alkaliphila]|uniref:IclR family transcriptional regulator n=2 Tax=Phytoactinopolyspora alkaliphila TaxID=1783498 RepID=A0A6N9YSW1_9ACTN|nr:IclR family transcriptional regulator [Phytoactinopolyspora alkaliphila]NED97918.1 IclR family transcriptional regulator [Phytoactinopolyspora alkaliphila]
MDKKYNIRVVERFIFLLNLLQETVTPMSLAKICTTLKMSKATTFRYLWTLERWDYVERNEKGHYRVGIGFVRMQSQELRVIQDRARAWLEKLRKETGESAELAVLNGDHVICVETATSTRSVRMASTLGSREPLHCTALGKAIASDLPADDVRAVLERTGMPQVTENSITDVDRYFEELSAVGHLGYAIDDREHDADGRCVAVPVLGTHLPVAISVSGPAGRMPLSKLEEIAPVLKNIAVRLTDPSDEGPPPYDEPGPST